MSLLPKESIKALAETAGLTSSLSDDICVALASDVEFRLREITQEAMKFMQRSKREILTTDDINSALRLRNVEALFGYSSKSSDDPKFNRAIGSKDVFYLQDKLLDFNEIIQSPLPKVPRDVSLTSHWLAIEGVQPAIPQNPSPSDIPDQKKRKHNLSASDSLSSISLSTSTEVKPMVKHVLSKEIQLYYERIISSIRGTNEELSNAALTSIREDPSLHQLLPYFTQFISNEVTHNLKNLPMLTRLMRMVQSILDSEHFHIDLYLHQLMPPILTCVVARMLGDESTVDKHWELRDFAATLVFTICKRYGNTYQRLQPRITNTLVQAFLDPTKPLTTHYGAITAIALLGHHSVETLLIPNIPTYTTKFLLPELNEDSNPIKRKEAEKCFDALLVAVGTFLSKLLSGTEPSPNMDNRLDALRIHYKDLFAILSDRLKPFLKQQPEDVVFEI